MDSAKPAVDLEKELTCSICTELLYQPLTLLDCLHTFCGACLKEWFTWQALAAETAPTPPAPGSPVFTCPSCRAPVRDTRHNATVATLLDMFLAANPDKRKSEAERDEMNGKYRPGDQVLPALKVDDKTPEQRRAEEGDRRLIEEVRAMSLQEAVAGSSSDGGERRRRRRAERDSREGSRTRDSRARDARDRSRRHAAEEENRRRAEQSAMLQVEGGTNGEQSRRRSGSRQRAESSEIRRRAIEHQSSIRSLISSSDPGSLDIEREIEAFARQIQEEGLLDGLDLDNIDLSNNDELSRRITEAYRRRQRERTRHEAGRRSNVSAASRPRELTPPEGRSRTTDRSRTTSRQRAYSQSHSRSASVASQSAERSRPPLPSSSTSHLEVREEQRRHRRRTTSEGRSSTLPISGSQSQPKPTSRSQTDLALARPGTGDSSSTAPPFTHRPSLSDGRSSSTPVVSGAAQTDLPNSHGLSFSARMPQQMQSPVLSPTHAESPTGFGSRCGDRPTDLNLPTSGTFASPVVPDGWNSPSSPSAAFHSAFHRSRHQLYPEPSITCERCGRQHIEYTLHYNCGTCKGGNYNICLPCYRKSKGCLHWYGFEHNAAWKKWQALVSSGRASADDGAPHMLSASRYVRPKQIPGGAEGRKTLTAENPADRLQSGTFCARCTAWTNDCYWRCDACNDGDWGFCNDCVNTGRCCTHPLLPLAHFGGEGGGGGGGGAQTMTSTTPPSTPRSAGRPRSATFFMGPGAVNIGTFRPLTFRTHCDACRSPIAPAQSRYHCFACSSSLIAESRSGDYDICQGCYAGLVSGGAISWENGPEGWRRCPRGHRMVVVAFHEDKGGQRRVLVSDLVGGRRLLVEVVAEGQAQHQHQHQGGGDKVPPASGLERWVWYEREHRRSRLVTKDVRLTAESTGDGTATTPFPPSGGFGTSALARYAWHPAEGADDELMFPKGAEIKEVEDVNGDWFHGIYMGTKGLFPAPYVAFLDSEGGGGGSS